MAGELIVAPHQYEFRDLLFGSGTDIIVETFEGLLSMPDVESDDRVSHGDLGSFAGTDLLTGKSVNAKLWLNGSKGAVIEQLLADVRAAFQSTSQEYPLVFSRPEQPRKRVYVRCRKRDIPTSYDLALGLGEVSVEFYATDPRVYSDEEYVEELTVLAGSGSGQISVNMNGDLVYGVHPVVEIDGPAVNPIVVNADDHNYQLQFTYTVAAGHTLVVDLQHRTALLDGVTNIYGPGVVNPATRWWSLLPGENRITLNRTGTTGAPKLRVRWRDAYS